jgi:hypothetical protein
MAFPPDGSEVVTLTAGVRMPCTKVASSLGILPKACVFVTAFMEKIYHTRGKKSIPVEGNKQKIPPFGHHNNINFATGIRLRFFVSYVNARGIQHKILCRRIGK